MLGILSGSLACFGYNLGMAAMSIIIGPDTLLFIERMIPFKGTISTAVGFYGLSQLDASYFSLYQTLLDGGIIVYAFLETTQVCHLSFKASRFLKERIDFDNGICQAATLLILAITILATIGASYFSLLPLSYESVALWLSMVILLTYTLLAERNDAIIMNGALMSLYLAYITSLDLRLLGEVSQQI